MRAKMEGGMLTKWTIERMGNEYERNVGRR
jgi:hypothetical protein